MNIVARFIPAIFGLIVLLGSILPLTNMPSAAGAQPASLLGLPGVFDQAGAAMAFFSGIVHDQAAHTSNTASDIAKFLYVVPLIALAVILLNVRGRVSGFIQFMAGASWIVISVGVPLLAAQALVASSPLLKAFQSLAPAAGGSTLTFDPGIGGWLILLSSIGIILHAVGILRVRTAADA